jgi:hypothetical protein
MLFGSGLGGILGGKGVAQGLASFKWPSLYPDC